MSPARLRFVATLLVIIGGAWLAVRSALAVLPPERDVWYVVSDGHQDYGYTHVIVRHRDDGAVEFTVDSMLMIEFFGAQQELESAASAIIEPNFATRSMEARSGQLSGDSAVRVRATDNGYTLHLDQGGSTEERAFTFNDDLATVSSLALGDWLHWIIDESAPDAAAGFTRQLRLVAAESGEPQVTTVRLKSRDDAGSIWALEFEEQWLAITLHLDHDGVMIEQSTSTPRSRVTRATPERAKQITHRIIPDRELLVFPFDRELPPTRRLQRLDVRLTWQDIPRDEFNLEDSRQRVISFEESEGRSTAVVRLDRPGATGPDITLPVDRAAFESTLAATDYILPEDERIATLAAEIVGRTTSAREAAAAICKWVSEYIEPAMIAETLSGPQVLERRTGKCTEYSTLYASLARAAGIPTRIALGERRFAGADGDTWGGHMWNEVYLGQWVPVDASVNEVGGSLDLLKFIHSDTVLGTQPLRWKLTHSLSVSIADVELIPVAPGEALVSGLKGGIYTSAEHGFHFAIPDETWRVEDTPAAGAQVLRLRPPDADLGDSAMFHVTAFSIPGGIAPKVILDARLNQQKTALEDVEVMRDEPVELAGGRGHRFTFGGKPKREDGIPLRISEVLLIHGESAVLINLISTIENHERFADTFEQIVSSVSFIE